MSEEKKEENKLEEKEEEVKILNIKLLKGHTLNKALRDYLDERKMVPHEFGGIPGYLRAIIDSNIKDKELREGVLRSLHHFVSEHFWAGVFLGKSKPDMVDISYKEIDNKTKSPNYLG